MDRDFVLNLFMETEEKSVAHLESDGDGHIALASFYPKFPSMSDNAPRCITIIVDCSGSMGGDSIAQARKALYEILELLRPEDEFNVVRFGSSYQMLFPAPVQAEAGNLKKAKNLLEVLEADMGGTEIGQAVAAAIKGKRTGNKAKDVLLITDGEVWDWEKVTAMAAKSGFRFFTVGVGSSVSEAFVQTLADATGGACELVSPHEDMAEKIVRHFKRIYFSKAENVKILWPGEPLKTFPEHINAVYDGDTLHVFGKFKERPNGDVELRAELENGETIAQKLPLHVRAHTQKLTELPGTTARMAAACEIRRMEDPKEIAVLGVKYQLMSRFTNYLAIDVKVDSEKAGDLPALRKTPQMLAAGWGGSGTILQDMSIDYMKAPLFSRRLNENYSEPKVQDSIMSIEDLERRKLDRFIDRLNRLQAGLFTPLADISSIKDLEAQGVPEGMVEALMELVDTGVDEQTVVTVFLYMLSQEKQFKKRLTRSTKRILTKVYKQLPDVLDEVQQQIKVAIESYLQTNGSR
jgi:Ca-activated chloride channel family protein